MNNISASKADVNRLKEKITSKAKYLLHALRQYQFIIALINHTKKTIDGICPSATRGNNAYAYQRRYRYSAIKDAIITLIKVGKQSTNAFMITLTYTTPNYNPDRNDIAKLKRKLRASKITVDIITAEAHKSGAIHYHAIAVSESQHGYFMRHGRAYSKIMRDIVRDAWGQGFIDVQAITEPKGAGKYIMKEIAKQSQCEGALKRWDTDEDEFTEKDAQKIHLHYYAKENRKRTLSVSRRLSEIANEIEAQTKAQEIETETAEEAAEREGNDLITISNNPTEPTGDRDVIEPFIIPKAEWRAITGRPPPAYAMTAEQIQEISGKLLKHIGKVYPNMLPEEAPE